LYADPSHERIALVLQRQLQEVGVEVVLEEAPVDKALARVNAGDFDAFLADAVNAPTLVRPYLFWHSGGTYNWGHFSSPAVDAALDHVRHAQDDTEYRAGVAAFQRAIVDDPPAIFLAWSERARAVSTRFEVPVEPGRDILSTLRLWRPVSSGARTDVN
jgi:ABC-type transport system substrate-binding protein